MDEWVLLGDKDGDTVSIVDGSDTASDNNDIESGFMTVQVGRGDAAGQMSSVGGFNNAPPRIAVAAAEVQQSPPPEYFKRGSDDEALSTFSCDGGDEIKEGINATQIDVTGAERSKLVVNAGSQDAYFGIRTAQGVVISDVVEHAAPVDESSTSDLISVVEAPPTAALSAASTATSREEGEFVVDEPEETESSDEGPLTPAAAAAPMEISPPPPSSSKAVSHDEALPELVGGKNEDVEIPDDEVEIYDYLDLLAAARRDDIFGMGKIGLIRSTDGGGEEDCHNAKLKVIASDAEEDCHNAKLKAIASDAEEEPAVPEFGGGKHEGTEGSHAAESDNAELKDTASDTEEGSDASPIAADMADTKGPTPAGLARRYVQTMEEALAWPRPAQVALLRKLKHEMARVALEREAAAAAASQSTVTRRVMSAPSAAVLAGVGTRSARPVAWASFDVPPEPRRCSEATDLADVAIAYLFLVSCMILCMLLLASLFF